jgi:hypothetical protein
MPQELQHTRRVPHPSQHHRDGWDVSRRAMCRFVLVLLLPLNGQAQQLIGYVSARDADVTGASDIVDGHAVLSGSAAVTAKDHTAPITLGRGGAIRVCQTSILHLTESKAAPAAGQLAEPLLLSLDRGAIEIQMAATASDAVMTPDLRLAFNSAGPLDLRLRIARNGDTCVENRGLEAPTLNLSDPFGGASYQLLPNQHVLFEHGSLHEVVDHETIPCGCPDTTTGSIADALLAGGSGGTKSPAPQQETHPFPAAVSEGLAPAPEVPQAPPGQVHAQITDSLSYSAPTASPAPPTPPTSAAATPSPTAQPPAEQKHSLFHAVGHFFRKLFGAA